MGVITGSMDGGQITFTDEEEVETDPVCGMSVAPANAAGTSVHGGREYFFCSEECKRQFDASPERYLGEGAPGPAL
jgi:YHS domain-containing protein